MFRGGAGFLEKLSSSSLWLGANELQFAAAAEKLVKKQIRAGANYGMAHCSRLNPNTAFRVASRSANAAGASKVQQKSHVHELPLEFKAACERTSEPINEFFSHLRRRGFCAV